MYTQVVWADTYAVGCGLVNFKVRHSISCNSLSSHFFESGSWYKTMIACNYAVGGNMMGSSMYKVGEGCSECPAGTACDSTFDKLCA